jgi:signal transduction histidine kinase
VSTFQSFQQHREITLSRSAELLADLPDLKALMTTRDSATIQDGSLRLWTLARSDLFVLADPAGRVVALHTSTPGFNRGMAQESLLGSLQQDGVSFWWFGAGHLYQVFLQPVYFGAPSGNSPLGVLAVGHEVNDNTAREVSRVAASDVAFWRGDTLVVSTLSLQHEAELARYIPGSSRAAAFAPQQVQLGNERFLVTFMDLAPGARQPVRLSVLISYDKSMVFLDSLNRLLVLLGALAILAGSGLAFLISLTMTRPLARLAAGTRALGKGDFDYSLAVRGSDEVAEVAGAFERMRENMRRAQSQLLDAERMATIGRMASSISHDLRLPLSAVVANAEFLCETGLGAAEREDLYQEIRSAVARITDLVDSLLEFSRDRESLRCGYGRVEAVVESAVRNVRSRPEFQDLEISVSCAGLDETWFDPKRIERGLTNILLNACEAVPPESGKVAMDLRQTDGLLEIRVVDNGPGVPEKIRDILFQPL